MAFYMLSGAAADVTGGIGQYLARYFGKLFNPCTFFYSAGFV